ncbi:unnamed protein product [Gordionus sp. m RMFG-2023]
MQIRFDRSAVISPLECRGLVNACDEKRDDMHAYDIKTTIILMKNRYVNIILNKHNYIYYSALWIDITTHSSKLVPLLSTNSSSESDIK